MIELELDGEATGLSSIIISDTDGGALPFTYYDGDDEDLTPVEGYNEHFINLQDILINAKERSKSIDEQLACQKVGFRLIHDGIAHLRIRTINQAIKNDYSLEKISKASKVFEEGGNLSELFRCEQLNIKLFRMEGDYAGALLSVDRSNELGNKMNDQKKIFISLMQKEVISILSGKASDITALLKMEKDLF